MGSVPGLAWFVDHLRTPVAFIIVLGVLVFVHELGHYLAARWRGVHVEVFSIGFGGAIASWTDRVGTVWKLCWLPLGGYVKLHGQERPDQVADEVRAAWVPGRTFHEKAVSSRAIVIMAGPLANFGLAFVLFSILVATVGQPVLTARISELQPGKAAQIAGLRKGDEIRAIDGVRVKRFEDLRAIVAASPGKTVALAITRDGAEQTLPVTIGISGGASGGVSGGTQPVGLLGVMGTQEFRRLGPLQAIGTGVTDTWSVIAQIGVRLWEIVSGQRSIKELGGPLRIAQLSGEQVQLGLANFVGFIAMLSVNLGLMNLLPIPVLDGGHLVFYLIEALRGRPVPPRAQEIGFRAGLTLLACLFLFISLHDLVDWGLFRWVASAFG